MSSSCSLAAETLKKCVQNSSFCGEVFSFSPIFMGPLTRTQFPKRLKSNTSNFLIFARSWHSMSSWNIVKGLSSRVRAKAARAEQEEDNDPQRDPEETQVTSRNPWAWEKVINAKVSIAKSATAITKRSDSWIRENVPKARASISQSATALSKKSDAWLRENAPILHIMGACLSSNSEDFIQNNDGGEEAYHSRFLEDRVLGEGQFGVVKLVHDMKANEGEGELMASKVLRKGVVFKDNTLYTPLKPEVMQMECDILRTLAGKKFCLELVGIYETPRMLLMVTEYCSGGEMMEYVAKQEELRTEDASRIAFQLLSAVDHCAKHNILHRDIKPENTMFKDPTRGAALRLIDFGSGTKDPASRDPEEFHTTFAGSAFYISPEMFQRTYTFRTDVWSAGAALYVLVAGYPADELQKAFNILQKKNRDLRTLPGMPEDMPDSFIDMLDKLLTYRHKTRPSAGEMLSHEFVQFHKSLDKEGMSVDEVAALAASPAAEGARMKRRRTQSIRLMGSVKAHSMFLNYQQFARSVTTLLATILTKADFEVLLGKLKERAHSVGQGEEMPVAAESTKAKNKLKIVRINEMKSILGEMKQEKA